MRTVNDITRGEVRRDDHGRPELRDQATRGGGSVRQLFRKNPSYQLIAGDLVFEGARLALFATRYAERFKAWACRRKMQQMINKDKQVPPEVAQGMARVQGMAQQVQQHAQLVQQAATEAQQEKAAAEKAKSDAQIAAANVKVLDAQFKADVANFKAEQAQQQAQSSAGDADSTNQQYGEIIQKLGDTVSALEQRLAMLGQHTAAAVTEVHQAASRPPPDPYRVRRSSRAVRNASTASSS
jgi:hypothetical protein